MGTSTSNPGPIGRPPLLPPWAEPVAGAPAPTGEAPAAEAPAGVSDGAASEANQPPVLGPVASNPSLPFTVGPSWNSPRRLVGSVTSGRVTGARGRDTVRRAVRRSVSAMGGRRGAAASSVAGRQTAGRLASFLAGVATKGVASAARTFGVAEFLGRSADFFLLKLADTLAPSGALTEDAIARDAMDATLEELYEQLDLGAEGVEALERLTPGMMADAVVRYVVNYIYGRVIQALTAHIHATATSATRIRDVEQTARQYIEDAVRLDLDTSPFFGDNGRAFAAQWDAAEGQRLMDSLFTEAYRVIQVGLNHGDRPKS